VLNLVATITGIEVKNTVAFHVVFKRFPKKKRGIYVNCELSAFSRLSLLPLAFETHVMAASFCTNEQVQKGYYRMLDKTNI